jgi:hypothetical protein
MKGLLIFKFLCLCLTMGYAQDIINNNSNLKPHKLFGAIEVAVPETVSRLETNKEIVEEMGFANFLTKDEKIDIKIREMDETDLSQVKGLIDALSTSLYNGTILRSELVKVNNIEFFVTDIKGQWNGSGDVIGMFRYYFNAQGNSYNLLMKYPADLIDKTNDLKDKMLRSVKIVQ